MKNSVLCPICARRSAAFYAEKKDYKLYRCQFCLTLFIWPPPALLNNIYHDDYFTGARQGYGYADYEHDKKSMMSTFNKYLAAIEKIQPLKGRLLDVGTATGIFLQRAQTAGWNATGLELSEYAAHQARAKGLNVRTGSLAESTFNAAQFDAVTLWDVFEHLPQPDDSLKYINKILKPGGVLAMSTPDCRSLYARLAGKRWHLIKPPEHVFLYNLKSLKMILNRHGFAIKTISKISKAYSLAYIFTILYGWQKKLFWLKCAEAVKKSRLNNIVIPIHLRDNIFIIAKKI